MSTYSEKNNLLTHNKIFKRVCKSKMSSLTQYSFFSGSKWNKENAFYTPQRDILAMLIILAPVCSCELSFSSDQHLEKSIGLKQIPDFAFHLLPDCRRDLPPFTLHLVNLIIFF